MSEISTSTVPPKSNGTGHENAADDGPGSAHRSSSLSFPVVGIGASAGGVQALLRFFENAPADMGMAFVVVLHMSAKHVSSADKVLQNVTRMRVLQVSGPIPIEPNHVYVIAPGKNLTMSDGYLNARDVEPNTGRPVSIDRMFRSLAEAHGQHVMCIVMSGTGSDGAVGIATVKERGGVTLAQEPNDAEYAEMPQNAIQTDQVDLVMPVVEMPQRLLDIWNNAKRIALPEADPPSLSPNERADRRGEAEVALQDILSTLRSRTGHDFRFYKRATMLRRIERRLQVNGVPDLIAYRDLLRENGRETGALLKDMLIGVTSFFRDREAFESIGRDVLPALFQGKNEGDQVRTWVAGCSSGEEAYSLAILLSEQRELLRSTANIQVFATDIDESAVSRARAGVYPESIMTDVPPSSLRQFFVKTGAHYEVVKSIREKILFAMHNVLRDPPFSRLDMVSCRNLLIYLDRSVQHQVLEMFHYALYPNGYLFLGSSESADSVEDLFTIVDKKNRVYRAKAAKLPHRPALASPTINAGRAPSNEERAYAMVPGRRNFSFNALHQRVLEQYAPPSVIVNRDSKIVHMSDNAGRFLRYVGGEPSSNLIAVVLPELRLDLRTALFQAVQTGNSVEARRVKLQRDGHPSFVNMTVRPFHDAAADGDFVLVLFDEVQEAMTENVVAAQYDAGHETVMQQLEQELHLSKEQLQTTIEQYETSTEELKASNEELQAINEELRSATEELETSKEELQSVNEELITVNAELQTRIEETGKANDDLQNLITSTDIATIFVDRGMFIKRYTPSAATVFNLIGADVGRSLFDITHKLNYPELADDVSATFQSLRLIEREVASSDGRWFLARLLPYRTADDRIDGALLSLIETTARRSAEANVRAGEERLRLAAQTTNDFAIIVQDPDGRIVSWNAGAERVFGYSEHEAVGLNIEVIYTSKDREIGAPGREREIAQHDGRADDERWQVAKGGRRVYCSGVVTPLNDPKFTGYAKILRDLTDRKTQDDARQTQLAQERAVRAQAEAANRLKDDFLAMLSHELKHPLNLIHVKAEMLSRIPEARGVQVIQLAAQAIQRAVVGQAKIIDDLLDLSRVRTGKLALNLAAGDVAQMLATIAAAAEAEAASRGIALSFVGLDEPLWTKVDLVRFDQIVWNLLSNALKFTPRGGSVSVRLSREGDELRIDVTDTGIGIEASLLPHIFEMFSQGIEARRRTGGGMGIGLALVKQLVEMHAGRVLAQSDGAGRGTTVSVWLPLVEGRPARTTTEEQERNGLLAGVRTLVVDDDAETAIAFAALLQLEGAVVMTAHSGSEALAYLDHEPVDLLLCDIGMPGISGHELIDQVRSNPQFANLPAIALTGYPASVDENGSRAKGFDLSLTKPVSLDALIAAVEQVFFWRGAHGGETHDGDAGGERGGDTDKQA
ncbi:chemotaxis protein [Caballeronia sordidicola]|uniref:histidine kinase n=1 Tax=Caballeronia sordidicola TaxID=196367 RepID=A0A158GT39_CABSO|nr:CheR family methyltransferase [Caballeronia sordidicola]SAL35324.1 chemotaxis protein [Caballeronia sordidicola]